MKFKFVSFWQIYETNLLLFYKFLQIYYTKLLLYKNLLLLYLNYYFTIYIIQNYYSTNILCKIIIIQKFIIIIFKLF